MTPAACTGRSTVEVCLPVAATSPARIRSLIVMRSTAGLCFERSRVLSRAARGSWSWWSSSLCAEAPSLRATGDQTRARATTAAQSTYYSSVEHWDWNGVSPGTVGAGDSRPRSRTRLGGPRATRAGHGRVHVPVRRSGRPRRAACGHRLLQHCSHARAITIRKRDVCSSGSDRLLEKKGRSIRVRAHEKKRATQTESIEQSTTTRGNCRDRIIVSTCQQPPPHVRNGCSATRRNTQTFPDVPGLYEMRKASSWRLASEETNRTGSLLAHQI